MRELKFPLDYVGAFSGRIRNVKFGGLKTFDLYILFQGNMITCNSTVVAGVMRVSRLFWNICAEVVDGNQKVVMLEDIAKTICS